MQSLGMPFRNQGRHVPKFSYSVVVTRAEPISVPRTSGTARDAPSTLATC